ncbi:hypothetical protein [Flavobacterium subsaxonicum]|uniref:PKD domain-containing protein n=1 Tax=Flavobacterium subsaxonicum WB 4.1-42 = DSM 21790 TaxID=1121898 RepID=A0A0A2MQB0_9FLAO|nr:hypothetical protein [Flavobacterium subsaxonicum]KGO93736.1 hypothetical protein Q766_07205 [Flavobacterium subsaxonicum WB 4.1-42 = DSM 21790]
MKVNTILKSCFFAAVVTASGLFIGCTPEEVTSGNPLTQPAIDATYSATTPDGNHYTVVGTTDANVQYHTWKWVGVGEFAMENPVTGEVIGDATMNFNFATPGTYTLQHRVVGFIGGTNSVTEQTFVVTTYALGDNLLLSPNFETASDWTVLNISNNNAVVWTFNNGSATVSGGDTNYSGKGIYQAVNLEVGKYKIDMHVEGPGSTDTWFEVYLGAAVPAQGSDYGDGGTKIGLNTWAGCGNTPFNGQLAALACSGSGSDVEINEAGTYYFLVKSGSGAANGVNSITISNVSLRMYE